MALRLHGSDLPPAAREVEFARAALGRKWRFDFLIGTVGIEVDGGAFAPGGGRHASDADRDKLNHAAALGFRVLRFSPQQIERDPVGCVALVRRALEVIQ
jgi:very-short-patch-repair endonuclease